MFVSGRYRLEFGHEASKPMAFFGRYIEVTPHSRLVWTNDESDDGAVTTVSLVIPSPDDWRDILEHWLARTPRVRGHEADAGDCA
jgi:uncharacterized protein YndB with AHSA1/START domain